MFFPPDEGDPVTIIDWQLMSRGARPYDVAYFMSQSLDVEQRAPPSAISKRRYHDGLRAGGVRDYSFDDCFEDYRLATLWCVMYPVAMGAGMAGPTERGGATERADLAPLLRRHPGPRRRLRPAVLTRGRWAAGARGP